MVSREIAVLGLGRFGKGVAETFSHIGGNVIAIDIDQKKVDDIADKVAYAVRADVTDIDTVERLGLSNVDTVIIAMSKSFEASIIAIILCKELGVPYIVAKAQNKLQGNILEKVGADKVVYPEVEMGEKLAMTLLYGNFIDVFSLSDKVSIVETTLPKKWYGKTLVELDVRRRYGFNVIAVKENDRISIDVPVDEPLREGIELIVLGNVDELTKVFKQEV